MPDLDLDLWLEILEEKLSAMRDALRDGVDENGYPDEILGFPDGQDGDRLEGFLEAVGVALNALEDRFHKVVR